MSRQQTKCEHRRQRSYCLFCGGSQICELNKIKSRCLFCCGSQICEYNKIKSYCLFCGRSQICEHNRQRSKCLSCGGGGICEHSKRRSICKGCGGGQICEHNKERSSCKYCDPPGHLSKVVRGHVFTALKKDKEMNSAEYLGCNIETFKKHEQRFTEGMSWENYGEWHVDHKIPLKNNKPSLEKVFNGCITQIHNPCGQVKICQKDVDIFLVTTFHLLIVLNRCKNKSMGNCLSKFIDKPFTLHTPPLTAGHLKKVPSGIQNNPVKYFASGVHQNYGHEKFTQSIKSSLMDVYDRFPPQSC